MSLTPTIRSPFVQKFLESGSGIWSSLKRESNPANASLLTGCRKSGREWLWPQAKNLSQQRKPRGPYVKLFYPAANRRHSDIDPDRLAWSRHPGPVGG